MQNVKQEAKQGHDNPIHLKNSLRGAIMVKCSQSVPLREMKSQENTVKGQEKCTAFLLPVQIFKHISYKRLLNTSSMCKETAL